MKEELEDTEEENELDRTLRPRAFKEFEGQRALKENLSIFLTAAQNRGESLEHVLLYGPPGLGKTTLANIVSNEMGVNIKITSGPAIERTGDLASILTNIQQGDVVFIDEIHRLSKPVEEVLYPAMEDKALDIVIGKGPSARTVRLELPPFTLIGATTRVGLLAAPLRDRFGVVQRLDFYTTEDLQNIVLRSSEILSIEISEQSAEEIAKRSRGTPRIANRLLRRVRDYAEVEGDGKITPEIVDKALQKLGIDKKGLDKEDRRFLKVLVEKFNGGPVGLNSLSAALSEDEGTIEDVIEPFMLQLGFIKRTNKGRVASKDAFKHLGLEVPEQDTFL